jgi:hypothetical protein
LRVYLIGRGYQAVEVGTADAARRFMSWLAETANPVLSELIQFWLWQPPDAGGLGALVESTQDVAMLQAEILAPWQHEGPDGSLNGRAGR